MTRRTSLVLACSICYVLQRQFLLLQTDDDLLTYRACESVLPLEVQQLVICIPRDRNLSKR
eukprot:16832-Heterococcus_DN1.PRE.2